MKALTKAEEQIMQVLWKLEQAFLREIVDEMPVPKPHQNTVATLLKILVEKEFVAVEVLGRQHRYSPLISKEDYWHWFWVTWLRGVFRLVDFQSNLLQGHS